MFLKGINCSRFRDLFDGFRFRVRTRMRWNADDMCPPSKLLLLLGFEQRPDHADGVYEPKDWVCLIPGVGLFSGVLWRWRGGGWGGRRLRRGDLQTDVINEACVVVLIYLLLTWYEGVTVEWGGASSNSVPW